MPVAVACPHCRQTLSAPESLFGKAVRCRSCQGTFVIGTPNPSPAQHPAAVANNQTIMAKPAPAPPPAPAPARQAAAAPNNRTIMAIPAPAPPPAAPNRVASGPPLPPLPGPPPINRGSAPSQFGTPPPLPQRRKSGMLLGVGVFACLLVLGSLAAGLFYFPWKGLSSDDRRFGVIEIGNAGLRGMVVRFMGTGEALDWEIQKELDRVVDLGKLNVDGKAFRPEALNDTKKTVTDLVEEMRTKYQVPSEKTYVICSSGLFSGFKEDAAAIGRAKVSLKAELQEATGGRIDFVDEEQEAHYTILSSVAPKDREEYVLFDVGSGNTKGGYISDNQFYAWSINYGTRTLFSAAEKQARVTKEPLAEVLDRLGQKEVLVPLQNGIESHPGLARRQKVILTGGIVWGAATYTHPDDLKKDRVKLTAADIQTFAEMVANKNEQEILDTVLASMKSVELKSEVRQEVGRVQDKVAKDKGKNRKLMGGAEILRKLSSGLGFANKEVVFFRKGRFAWPMGYLMKKAGIE